MENPTLPTNWLAALSNARSASRWVTLVQQEPRRHSNHLDFWNPAPLMQNYMIKSVKMTKKSIFRDQFSWKVRTFAPVFSQRHHFILLNYPVELRPRTRFSEQIQIHIEAAHHSADFYHSVFGAVAGLTGYVGRGLRFLYAHTDSASPNQTLMREL